MDYTTYCAAVATRTGLQASQVTRAVEVTLRHVGERMRRGDREVAAAGLPPEMAAALCNRPCDQAFDLAGLFERVAAGEGERLGVAVEHALSACQVLAEGLDDASLDAFRVALPREFAGLFACYRRPQAVQRSGGTLASGRSLASGRPGTARPLSEAHRVEAFE